MNITQRLLPIDFLRGIAILLMTIDHCRDMFASIPVAMYLGTELPLSYYLTRLSSHICAPAFILLSGLSVYLKQEKYNQPIRELQINLIKRGLFLIFLAIVIMSPLWNFILNSKTYTLFLTELWAIGWGLIFISFMLNFKPLTVTIVSLIIIFGHNFLNSFDNIDSLFWALLHTRKTFPLIEDTLNITTYYPLLAWFGISGIGYSLGYYLYNKNISEEVRNNYLLKAAMGCFILFLILRYVNFYGDPNSFTIYHESLLKTLYSFFDLTKYPPSLLFTLLTLGFCFKILWFTSKYGKNPSRLTLIISEYGNCALFYFIFHLFLICALVYVVAYLFNNGRFLSIPNIGLSYFMALVVAIITYPIIKWFNKLKNKYKSRVPLFSYF
mgnify:CR=1 FL=1